MPNSLNFLYLWLTHGFADDERLELYFRESTLVVRSRQPGQSPTSARHACWAPESIPNARYRAALMQRSTSHYILHLLHSLLRTAALERIDVGAKLLTCSGAACDALRFILSKYRCIIPRGPSILCGSLTCANDHNGTAHDPGVGSFLEAFLHTAPFLFRPVVDSGP